MATVKNHRVVPYLPGVWAAQRPAPDSHCGTSSHTFPSRGLDQSSSTPGDTHLSLGPGRKAEPPACCLARRGEGEEIQPRSGGRSPGHCPDLAIRSPCGHGQFPYLFGPHILYLSNGLIMPIYLTWLLRESDLFMTMQVFRL